MIREFNQECEQDYVRKTVETLQSQTDRRKSVVKKNSQRTDIDETLGEGGGDEDPFLFITSTLDSPDGESEDDNENLSCHQCMSVSNQYAKTSGRTWRIGGSQI